MKLYYNPFFTLFDTKVETVLEVIKTLPDKDIKLLKKKYGENYTNILMVPTLTDAELKHINQVILRKIKTRLLLLNNGYSITYITDIFECSRLDKIRNAIIKTKKLSYFTKVFGPNLDKPIVYNPEIIGNNFSLKQDVLNVVKKELYQFTKVEIRTPFPDLFIKYMRKDEDYYNFVNRIKFILDKHRNEKVISDIYEIYGENLLNIIYYGQYNRTETKMSYYNAYKTVNYWLEKEYSQSDENTRKLTN